ncbi:hypothetical protein P3T73_09375 [Kiritimatiellota bacterium B12222]|nr:hypothetical protein P3T73_09375 [Kiritimatiellota bacterium B12222]
MSHSRLTRCAFSCLCLLFICSGFRFELLQIGAWSEMLVSYTNEGSISDAFENTFSGEQPCEKCKALTLEKTQNTETNPTEAPSEASQKLELALNSFSQQIPPPHTGRRAYNTAHNIELSTLAGAPVPPPPIRFS